MNSSCVCGTRPSDALLILQGMDEPSLSKEGVLLARAAWLSQEN